MPSNLVNAINTGLRLPTPLTDIQLFNEVVADAGISMGKGDLQGGQDFAPYGQDFKEHPEHIVSYMNNVAEKYGLVFIKSQLAKNPLSVFKRGKMPYGGKLESIVFDVIKPNHYSLNVPEGNNPFALNFGRVLGDTYTQWMDLHQWNTIVDTQDNMYFQNAEQFNTFIAGKIFQLVNGFKLEEYKETKEALTKSLANGLITTEKYTAGNWAELQEKIIEHSQLMQYFTPKYNAGGITQATMVDDLEVLLPVKSRVHLQMDFIANMFNAELAGTTNVNFINIDGFGDLWLYETDHVVTATDIQNGFVNGHDHPEGSTIAKGTLAVPNATDAFKAIDGTKIGAMIMDKDALQLWDDLPLTLSTVDNSGYRTVNIFANQKTAIMFVQNLNSLAIIEDGYEIDVDKIKSIMGVD